MDTQGLIVALEQLLAQLKGAGAPPVPVQLPVPLPAGFDEAYYLESNPDVAAAVRAGHFTSGGQHYMRHGMAEGRPYAAPAVIPHTQGPMGWRVDDVVPAGTLGTVTLPKTGNTLSLPQPNVEHPERGEMLVGYIARVHKQCGEPLFPQGLGSLFLGTDGLFSPGRPWDAAGTFWPEAADKFYNREAYATDEEKARDAASAAQWDQHWAEKAEARAKVVVNKQPPPDEEVVVTVEKG